MERNSGKECEEVLYHSTEEVEKQISVAEDGKELTKWKVIATGLREQNAEVSMLKLDEISIKAKKLMSISKGRFACLRFQC